MSMSYAAKHLADVLHINHDSESSEKTSDGDPKATGSSTSVGSEKEAVHSPSPTTLRSQVSEDNLRSGYGVNSDGPFSMDTSDGPVELRIPVPWGHIAAKTWGSSRGHPVIGVHGWMDNAATFDALAPLLPKSLYFVAVDLPGHGFSSHLQPGTPYHYTDFITSLRRIVKYFKWTKFSWIGHSMGAGLGSLYSSLFPTEVDRLVMLDLVKLVSGDTTVGYANRIANAIDMYLGLEGKITPDPPTYSYEDAVKRLMLATDNTLTEKAAKIMLTRGSRRVSENEWIFTRDILLRSPTIMRFSHQQCFDVLKEIRCPMMIIKAIGAPWFEKRELCDQALKIYRENSANFQFIEVAGNHFVHLNEPERVAGHVSRFFTDPTSSLQKSAL